MDKSPLEDQHEPARAGIRSRGYRPSATFAILLVLSGDAADISLLDDPWGCFVTVYTLSQGSQPIHLAGRRISSCPLPMTAPTVLLVSPPRLKEI